MSVIPGQCSCCGADLTVDGSFVTGGAMAAVVIVQGHSPILATVAALLAGAAAGTLTGLVHTKLKIDPLLSSILVMLALYSINTRIMWLGTPGASNVGLLRQQTIFSGLFAQGLRGSWVSIASIAAGVVVVVIAMNWFMATRFGLAIWATGDSPAMASSLGISTDLTKIVTLAIANGLVGLAGGVWAQYVNASYIQDGAGMILIGLASVILGNAIFGTRFLWLATFGVVAGAVLYRVAIYWALRLDFIDNSDMKLMSAVIVVIALVATGSTRIHEFFGRLTPWRSKRSGTVPMSIAPNPFSPLASVDAADDAAAAAAVLARDEEER
jgi:putative ABC transport system permease protein